MNKIQDYIASRLLVSVLTGILWMLCFEPFGFAISGFIAFIPWFFVVRKMYGFEIVGSALIISGFLSFGNLGWISNLHIGGFGAVAAYFWFSTMLLGFVTKYAHKKNFAYSSLIVVSTFVTLEVIRSYINLPLTFPWLKFGYSQSNFLPFAQVADIGGAYLVSGILIYINWILTVFLIDISQGFRKYKLLKPLLAVILFGVVLGYGFLRMYQINSQKMAGPTVALIQPNRVFPDEREVYKRMDSLVKDAITKADIIAIPETMFPSYFVTMKDNKLVLRIDGKYWLRTMLQDCENPRVKYFIGGISLMTNEKNKYLNDALYRTNSSILFNTDGEVLDDYSKIGLVPIGEYVPYLQFGYPSMKIIAPVLLGIAIVLILLKLILAKKCRKILGIRTRVVIWIILFAFLYASVILTGSAYIKDVMIAGFASAGLGKEYIPNDKPGVKYTKFSSQIPDKNNLVEYNFATPICYELAYPDILRKLSYSDDTEIDFFINLSNDNFYKQSAELDQMLNIGRFRCIENRKAMGRCTTTGISAFVSATGKIEDFIQVDGKKKEVAGVLIHELPVHKVRSLYSKFGDWFAWLCFVVFCFVLIHWIYSLKEKKDPNLEAHS